MNLKLSKSSIINNLLSINITGSKSESNRLLLLQALYHNIHIENLSNSDDSQLMQKALLSKEDTIDIHHAGTAMRFLTAYFSIQEDREITLTGSKRMTERPIKILVDALKSIGADISYLKNEGYPPLQITGKQLKGGKVNLKANISSQYISALMLIGSKLKNGLQINLEEEITSVPYIKMTQALLEEIGVESSFIGNVISIKPKELKRHELSKTEEKTQTLTVESDWSSVSYFYSIIALSDFGTQLTLSSYKKNSLQGDSVLADIYKQFGVVTTFHDNSITLQKSEIINSELPIKINLVNAPDIAQTIAITCFGLSLECVLTGLHTLKIKETDRLFALKTEIEKLDGEVNITDNSLHLSASKNIKSDVAINTYNDHRMAMAFAPLALKTSIVINNANVVSKSYPDFWSDLTAIGFSINKK